MEMVKDMGILKAIAKRYHLEFCPKYKYYTGNTYNNSQGESLPNYFGYKGGVYALQYVSGCFNPFLVNVTLKVKGEIESAYKRKEKEQTQEWQERIQKYIDSLNALFLVK